MAGRRRQESCPKCGEDKVVELNEKERDGLDMELHKLHVIQRPFEDWRIWACLLCGWTTVARWSDEAYSPLLYNVTRHWLIVDEEGEDED